MMNLKKAGLVASLVFGLASAAVAATNDKNDVVTDSNGQQVVSSNGNCVITKWESNSDICGFLSKKQLTVYFDFNKSGLSKAEKAKLNEVVRIIKESQKVESVDIVGYADQIGTSSYNKRLSTKRANNVKAYLASKGLKTRNVRVEGKGDSASVTNCADIKERAELISCLAEDRRVEIKLNFKK